MKVKTPNVESSTIHFSEEEIELYFTGTDADVDQFSNVGKVRSLFKTFSSDTSYAIGDIIERIETNIQRIKMANNFLKSNEELLKKLEELEIKEDESQKRRLEDLQENKEEQTPVEMKVEA